MKRRITDSLMTLNGSKSRKPLILRGVRQVGKTYVLQEFGQADFPNYHYLNFEQDERLSALFERDLSPARILEELQFYLDKSIDRGDDLVIFDEIQQCPRALTALKYFCEQMPELALCAAGSLLGVGLSREAFPVGKVTFLDLYPMSFEEFLEGIGKQRLLNLLRTPEITSALPEIAHEQLWDMWKRYLVVGGLPEAVNTYRENLSNPYEAMKAVRMVQRDLFSTYIADIAKHAGKANAMHVERLWRNVTRQLSQSQDGSAPKFRFKDVTPGIRGYERLASPLSWLETTRLVLRTSIVDWAEIPLASFAKENRFKQFFFDVGMLGAVSDIAPARILEYQYGTYKGFFAENYVAQELRTSGVKALYGWEGKTSEVEFLLEGESGILPIEVKSGTVTQSKSLKVFEQRYHPRQSVVLSAKNVASSGSRLYLPLYLTHRVPDLLTMIKTNPFT